MRKYYELALIYSKLGRLNFFLNALICFSDFSTPISLLYLVISLNVFPAYLSIKNFIANHPQLSVLVDWEAILFILNCNGLSPTHS